MVNGVQEIRITDVLANGSRRTIRISSLKEQRVSFDYTFRRYADPEQRQRGWKPELVIEYTLYAEYKSGKLSTCTITLNVILPHRLGKVYLLGVDISPGAKTFLEFVYDVMEDSLRLTEIIKGACTRINLRELAMGTLPVRQIELPFPILDVVPLTHDSFEIPFLHADGSGTEEQRMFTVPKSIGR